MTANKRILNRVIDYIREKEDPEKIYLFGSYAKGTATKNSDLDIFIVKKSTLPKYKRTANLYSLDKTKKIKANIGIDFIIYTPAEFEKSKYEINSIAGEVNRDGKLVYAKKK